MNSYTLSIICVIISLSNAFTVQYSPRSSFIRERETSKKSCVGLSTTEMNDGTNLQGLVDQQQSDERTKMESWREYLQTTEVKEIRQQLIDKYLSLGRTQEYAETEIDRFLSDPSRSKKYLEMRQYVKSQQNASMGFENFLFYTAAFFFGLLGDAIFKYIGSHS